MKENGPEKILVIRSDKIIDEIDFTDTYNKYSSHLPQVKNFKKELLYFLNKRFLIDTYILKSDWNGKLPIRICPACSSIFVDKMARKTGGIEEFLNEKIKYQCRDCEAIIPGNFVDRKKGVTVGEARRDWLKTQKSDLLIETIDSKDEKASQNKLEDALKTTQYVDENGNSIDLSGHDLESLDYTDEWDRPCDYKGELLPYKMEEDHALKVAHNMIQANEMHLLLSHCKIFSELYPTNAELYSLLGLGYAAAEQILKARESFLKSIMNNLPAIDSMVFGNYITSCFDTEDKASALTMIEKYFEQLDFDGKKIVLESLHEAIRIKFVTVEDLSSQLKKILKLK